MIPCRLFDMEFEGEVQAYKFPRWAINNPFFYIFLESWVGIGEQLLEISLKPSPSFGSRLQSVR